LLDEIASAFRSDLPECQLILVDYFVGFIRNALPALRLVVNAATAMGHSVLALALALEFIYIMLTARGTTDLLQAQVDMGSGDMGLCGWTVLRIEMGHCGINGFESPVASPVGRCHAGF
jgi:6-phosphogluconate dehydrogenase